MEELIRRIANRDEAALTELHHAMRKRIVAFAMQRLDDPYLSEEVMLETLFEVWNHASRFAGQSQVSTWILGIARHKTLDKLRAPRSPWMDDLESAHLEIASNEADNVDRLVAGERAAILENCIKKLTHLQRECMNLVFYQELALEEIAAIQACPVNTVKTRLFHARGNLRECMQSNGHGERA